VNDPCLCDRRGVLDSARSAFQAKRPRPWEEPQALPFSSLGKPYHLGQPTTSIGLRPMPASKANDVVKAFGHLRAALTCLCPLLRKTCKPATLGRFTPPRGKANTYSPGPAQGSPGFVPPTFLSSAGRSKARSFGEGWPFLSFVSNLCGGTYKKGVGVDWKPTPRPYGDEVNPYPRSSASWPKES